MMTEVFTLARGQTNDTFPTQGQKMDARTALWMDPLTSLNVDTKTSVKRKLQRDTRFLPGTEPVSAKQARPGTSLPPAYGFSKNVSKELQEVPVFPTSNEKPLDSGLNSFSSFLKLPWINPYIDFTMYPFLGLAYKAAYLAQSSPSIYQQLACPSLCLSGAESSSPEDRLFYLAPYSPAYVSSQLETYLRIHASTQAALTALHALQEPVHQDPSTFGTSLHQEPLSSSFHLDERHLNKNNVESCHPTSTETGPTSRTSSVCDPVSRSSSASVSMTVDSWKTLKRSTSSSTEMFGFSPVGSHSSKLASLGQTKSTNTTRFLSRERTSGERKVHQKPLDLSAKKIKESSDRAKSKIEVVAQMPCRLRTGRKKHLKDVTFPSANLSAKSPELSKMDSLTSTLSADVVEHVFQSLAETKSVQAGVSSLESFIEPFHFRKLDQPRVHTENSIKRHTFSGKHVLSKFEDQDNQPNLPKKLNLDVESISTQRLTDSNIPDCLGFSHGYPSHSTLENVSLQHASITAKGPGHFRSDPLGELLPGPAHRDLKEHPNKSLSKTCNVDHFRNQESQVKKPDHEQSGSRSKQTLTQISKSFCKMSTEVKDNTVNADVPFEDIKDEVSLKQENSLITNQPAGEQGLKAHTFLQRPTEETLMEEDSLTPSQDFSDQQSMHCARTTPEQFSKKKQSGGSKSLPIVDHLPNGLDANDEEDLVNQNSSTNIRSGKDSCISTTSTRLPTSPAVRPSSRSDGSVCTNETTAWGTVPIQVSNGAVNAKTESCVSINLTEQITLDESQCVALKPSENRHNVRGFLAEDHLLKNYSRVTVLSETNRNTHEFMDLQPGVGKDTPTSTSKEPFHGHLNSRPKHETEEPGVFQRSWTSQELCKMKENQEGEKAAAGEAALANDQWCDAGGSDGGGLELCQQSEGKIGDPPPTPHMEAERGLDPSMVTNQNHIFTLEPFHQSSIGGRWMKRRRTEDSWIKNTSQNATDVNLEDKNKQKSCVELNDPRFKKPRLPEDDLKAVHMDPHLQLPKQVGSAGLGQPSLVGASCIREKHQKPRANTTGPSSLLSSSDVDLENSSAKRHGKTKHTSGTEKKDGDGEKKTAQVSSEERTPTLQLNLVVEPVSSTLLPHATRLGDELKPCDVNHKDNAGYCALREACTCGWLANVRHLVEHGADINCSAQDGTRPLHDAVENNHVEVVRFLLSCGADPTLTSSSGQGPINMANSVVMETFLEEYLADLQGRSEGDPGVCWDFYGSSVCEPTSEGGVYDILANPPGPEDEEGEGKETDRQVRGEAFEFEMSDQPLLPCYTLQVSPSVGPRNWLLLTDVLNRLQMSPRTFRRLLPHLQVSTISEAAFSCQTTPSQIWTNTASFTPDAENLLNLVEATPELAAVLGSSLEFVDDREQTEPSPSPPSPAPPISAPIPKAAVERKADASGWATRNQVPSYPSHPEETANMLEAKNKNGIHPHLKTDSGVWEERHLQHKGTVNTYCSTEENLQSGDITRNADANEKKSHTGNEDNKVVPETVGEGYQKASRSDSKHKRQGSHHHDAWRRNLANVRVHIRDLGIQFAGALTRSSVMDYKKFAQEVNESKRTQQKISKDNEKQQIRCDL
ncbi:uncharacterized protein LOC144078192 isoform X2 [Stigmatopora argus]